MELEVGTCSGCFKETRRERGTSDHWWHVTFDFAWFCLWQMIASASYLPEFVPSDDEVIEIVPSTLPRQRGKRDQVPARV